MKQVDFGKGGILQNMLRTAMPMLLAQILSLLYNIVDRIYIGRIEGIGTTALGAVGLTFPIVIMITAFSNLYGGGGAPLFSIARGRGERKRASLILQICFTLILLTGIFVTAIGLLFGKALLILFGADSLSLSYALPYLRIYMIGCSFTMIATGLNPFINAQGYPGIGMAAVMFGAVSNIVLDPVFIFVLGLGVKGAAIATVISEGFSACFVLIYLYGKKPEYGLKRVRFFLPFAHAGLAIDVIALGTASFVMQVTNSLVSIICNRELALFGGNQYVSIMTMITSVRQMLEMPIHALADGTSPIISYNYGAGFGRRIRKTLWMMFAMMLTYSFATWMLVLWQPEFFIRIFSDDKELITKAVPALHLYFFAYVFMTLQSTGQTMFKSMNFKKQAIFFSLLRKVIIVVPLTLILPGMFGLGTDGVFMAEPISNVIGGLACFFSMQIIAMPKLKEEKQQKII